MANHSGLKVLVVDDSKVIRQTAEAHLKKQGYEVRTAENGYDALAVLRDFRPSIMFVDVVMPRLDGYQTCALIKKNAEFSSIPVVMLSSKDGLFDRARGRLVGSEEYLTKPFTSESLVSAIQRHSQIERQVKYGNEDHSAG